MVDLFQFIRRPHFSQNWSKSLFQACVSYDFSEIAGIQEWRPFLTSSCLDFGWTQGKKFYCNLRKSCFRTSLPVVISIVFAPLFPSFPIPLIIKFRDYLAAPPRKSQFHIFHVSVKMYVYLNMWALVHLLWLFMSSDGGHCPNDRPKNCSCTFFSKRSSLPTYIVDCTAMDNEQVPSGIPSNTVILYVLFFVNWIFAKNRSLFTTEKKLNS